MHHRADPANRITSGPWAEIDLTALCDNFEMARQAAPSAQTAAVVKCNAYGLGVVTVGTALAERKNCRTFFVAYPEEGAELREALAVAAPEAEIFVFNGPSPGGVKLFDEARLTPVLNSLDQARQWSSAKPGAPAALHIDTGMNRLGAPPREFDALTALPGFRPTLLMSHLACGSDPTHKKNLAQREAFIKIAERFPMIPRSLSASAGALMDPSYHFDLTRPGIALYGGSPFDVDDARIKPVVTLKAPIVQLRALEAGESIGYGATFVAQRPTRIAVAALGYGDGFPVSASNRAEAVIADERFPIAGRVSMDLVCLDVAMAKKPVEVGNIAVFFGQEIRLHDAARACETIPYELLTGLGGRIDRRYV